ncbi:MAG: hypothetical protein JF588_14990 [Caulobacterales bacterium]|nr:hypothetical protein [Caulobacterales bacterium]
MVFAKRVFTWAAIFGFVMVAPLLVAESLVARLLHHTLTQPQWYYAFAEVALGFQVLYLMIGRDPVRYRPLMPVCAVCKFAFGATMWTLVGLGRTQPLLGLAATPDMLWAGAFLVAYRLTPAA